MYEDMPVELHYVLVEGPGAGDARFLGRWLLAAAKADRTLEKQFTQKPSLKQQISRLEVVYCICFSSAATKFVELLMKNLASFSLPLEEEWGEIFAVMAELGFFRLTGDRYQMTHPKAVSGSDIVLVEGPGAGDARFLGRWLLAAAKADRTLEKQF